MSEAIVLLRAIANANQAFYLANGRYAAHNELDLLDIEIPGNMYVNTTAPGRIETKNFVYSSGSSADPITIAMAQRKPFASTYFISIRSTAPEHVYCHTDNSQYVPSAIQRKLCTELNTKGTL